MLTFRSQLSAPYTQSPPHIPQSYLSTFPEYSGELKSPKYFLLPNFCLECRPEVLASPGGDAGFWACSEPLAFGKCAVPDNSFKVGLFLDGALGVAFNVRATY